MNSWSFWGFPVVFPSLIISHSKPGIPFTLGQNCIWNSRWRHISWLRPVVDTSLVSPPGDLMLHYNRYWVLWSLWSHRTKCGAVCRCHITFCPEVKGMPSAWKSKTRNPQGIRNSPIISDLFTRIGMHNTCCFCYRDQIFLKNFFSQTKHKYYTCYHLRYGTWAYLSLPIKLLCYMSPSATNLNQMGPLPQ